MAACWGHQQSSKDVSKLSKWLALDADDLGPSRSQSTIGQTQPLISNATFESHPSYGQKSNSIDTFSQVASHSESSSSADERSSISQHWNVNANPFRPPAYMAMASQNHQAPQPLHPNLLFSDSNGGSFNGHMNEQQQQYASFDDYSSQNRNFPLPLYPAGHGQYQQIAPLPFHQLQNQPELNAPFQDSFNNHSMFVSQDNVWQNPDAEFRRWQQYTGTSVWGDPERKVIQPIQRWQEFDDDECVDMVGRVDKLVATRQEELAGWGDFPEMLTGTYGRIHQKQRSDNSSPLTAHQQGMVGTGTDYSFRGQRQPEQNIMGGPRNAYANHQFAPARVPMIDHNQPAPAGLFPNCFVENVFLPTTGTAAFAPLGHPHWPPQ